MLSEALVTVYMIALEEDKRGLELFISLHFVCASLLSVMCDWTYSVRDIINLDSGLVHSLDNPGVRLDHVAEWLGRANLVDNILGWRVIVYEESGEVVAGEKVDLVSRVQYHVLADIGRCLLLCCHLLCPTILLINHYST